MPFKHSDLLCGKHTCLVCWLPDTSDVASEIHDLVGVLTEIKDLLVTRERRMATILNE